MKALLIKEVRGLGKKGEIKDVNNGYANNYLFPNKLAVLATPEVAAKIEREKAFSEKRRKELVSKLKIEAKRLEETTFDFFMKTGGKGEIFGSVSATLIEKALAEKGFSNTRVLLERPIKNLGEFKIPADFGEGVNAEVRVRIIPE